MFSSHLNTAIVSLYKMIVEVNAKDFTCNILDCDSEPELVGTTPDYKTLYKQMKARVHPDDKYLYKQIASYHNMQEALKDKLYASVECRIRVDKNYRWGEVTVCHASEENELSGNDYLILIKDVNDRKIAALKREYEERAVIEDLQNKYNQLFRENMMDAQTGCYNRKGLKYYSDLAIHAAQKEDKRIFVCVADLNGLKYINDTFGHAEGDKAIAAASEALKRSAPQGSCIVRTGGDEFLIFSTVDELTEIDFGNAVEENLKKYNDKRGDSRYDVRLSFGYVIADVDSETIDLDKFVAMADEKMYEMKLKTDAYARI